MEKVYLKENIFIVWLFKVLYLSYWVDKRVDLKK